MFALTKSGFLEGMLPNKRLKLSAPGLGRNYVRVPADVVLLSASVALAAVGAAA